MKQLQITLAVTFSIILSACVGAATPAAEAPAAVPTEAPAEAATHTEAAAEEAPEQYQTTPTQQESDYKVSNPEILDIDESTPLCVVFPTLDGQQFVSRGTENGDGLAAKLGKSHGEIVFGTIIERLFSEMGIKPDETDPKNIKSVIQKDAVVILVVDNFKRPSVVDQPDLLPMMAWFKDIKDQATPTQQASDVYKGLLVVGVDIGSFEINQVSKNIQTAMNELMVDSADPVVKKFVINMSFALVPCNNAFQVTIQNYQQGLLSFTDFSLNLKALVAQTYGNGHMKLPSQITTSPFANFTKCLFGGNVEERECGELTIPQDVNIILVGAAGNSAYPFSFAPALWENFVSVSASDDSGKKASYSNTGEVMMDGSTSILDVVGTSFASPKLALEEAIYLQHITQSSQGITCRGDRKIDASPPLGYIPEAGDWETQGLDTDLPLQVAIKQYCDNNYFNDSAE